MGNVTVVGYSKQELMSEPLMPGEKDWRQQPTISVIGNTILIGQKLKGLIFSLVLNKAQNNIVSLLYVPLR